MLKVGITKNKPTKQQNVLDLGTNSEFHIYFNYDQNVDFSNGKLTHKLHFLLWYSFLKLK